METVYDELALIQSGLQLNFIAISIAVIKPIISTSNVNFKPIYLAKHPLEKPRQLIKIPPHPKWLGDPLAAPSILTLIQFCRRKFQNTRVLEGQRLALPLMPKLWRISRSS